MKNPIGSFAWADLTVEKAPEIRDFYAAVVGFTFTEIPMSGYNDYCMNSPDDGQTKSGICHARGGNAELPPMWLIYFYVKDLDVSLEKLKELGGEVLAGPKSYGGNSRYAVIKDPAGACCALFQEG